MYNSNYSQRNPAIDIFRALIMFLMIFVNDLWNISYPKWMGHAGLNEDMLGLSDIVFPCFLFAVGLSIPYALENSFKKGNDGVKLAGHILTRTLALLVMGVFLVNLEGGVSSEMGIGRHLYVFLLLSGFFLLWNQYPKTDQHSRKILYKILKIAGAIMLIILAIIFIDKGGYHLRPKWWGILGLIGWTYLVCAFIYFFTRDRLKYIVPIFFIFITWCMLKCNLISTGNPILHLQEGNALDAFAGIFHIDTGAHCALTMGGIITSVLDMKLRSRSNRKRILIALGLICGLIALGLISNHFWIISKLQATAPWVFYSCAISVALYSFLVFICSIGGEKWFSPIKPAGTATLTCYLMPYILYAILAITAIGTTRPQWCSSGILGVLSCIVFSFLCVGLTYLLGKVNIKLKI